MKKLKKSLLTLLVIIYVSVVIKTPISQASPMECRVGGNSNSMGPFDEGDGEDH